MQTKGQLMKSLNTAFSFAPPSILSLTICMSLLYHNELYRNRLYRYADIVCSKIIYTLRIFHTNVIIKMWVERNSTHIIHLIQFTYPMCTPIPVGCKRLVFILNKIICFSYLNTCDQEKERILIDLSELYK